MPKYSVPVIYTTEEIFIVKARSATEAGMKAAVRIANGEAADHIRELSKRVLSAKTITDDVEPPA